jgi:endonuclease-8
VPVAEWLDARREARQPDLRAMGPDLLGETFDEDEAVRRVRERDRDAIADVLLNQRVVAGIGNVYKSEVLFLCRINPFTPAQRRLRTTASASILRTARRLLQANVTAPRRHHDVSRILARPRTRRLAAPLRLRPRAQTVP